MPGTECVSEPELCAFVLGDLPERLAVAVGAHLETCPQCEVAAQRLDELTDPMIRSLQRALAPDAQHPTPPLPSPEGSVPVGRKSQAQPWFVDGYEILEELGRGGMGVVYKAQQMAPRRLVAVKMILAGSFADPGRRARLLAEGDALARLQHPNIVQIHEVGQHDDLPFLVLQYVAGGTLADRLRGTPQAPRQAAELVETLARAVHHAHTLGVVHRDLKPGNVLIDDDGVPRISDFGLARHDRPELTASGDMLGTPSYMAPEQAAGSHAVGPAADIWALGAILYEALTGRPPFQAATPLETLEQVRTQEPVPPVQLQSKMPRDLNTICLHCLQKEPRKRYASALDLADDLHRFLEHEPIRARRSGPLERLGRWCRRRPAVAALLAIVGALAVVTVVVSVASAWLLGIESSRARRAEHEAKEKLLEATFRQAQALRKSGEIGQRFQSLATLETAVGVARSLGVLDKHAVALRNEAVACLALADLRITREWEPLDEHLHGPWSVLAQFDADLKRYACPDRRGNIDIFETEPSRRVAQVPAPEGPLPGVDHRLSPDGRLLAAAYHSVKGAQLILWDISAPTPVRRLGPFAGVGSFALGDNGLFAVSHPNAALDVYRLDSGEHRTFPDRHARLMTFRPGGRQLAFNTHGEQHQVHVLDLESGQVTKRFHHPDEVHALAWSADGRLLAVGCDDRNVHVWDAVQWKQQAILEGHQGWIRRVAFSPVGDLLASYGLDETTRLWDPVRGRQLVVAPGKLLRFSGDGRRLAYRRGNQLGIWEVADGRTCQVLHHGRVGNRATWQRYKGPQMLDFSPDGQLLASAALDGVRLWHTADGRELGHLNAGHHEAVRFHPDGTLYTFGRTGIRAWPIREDRGPGTLRVGPARILATREGQGWFRGWISADGSLVAAGCHIDERTDRVIVFPPGLTDAEDSVPLGDAKVFTLCASPDGRWVAAAASESRWGVQVWDAGTGRPGPFLATPHVNPAFSPDGRWLVGSGDGYSVWEVGSWQPGRTVSWEQQLNWSGPPGFCPNSRLLAVPRSRQSIQLLDFATGQEVATLPSPDGSCIWWPCFSSKGRLLAVATESHGVHLWDLGAIGRHLDALGLGSDLLPAAAEGPPAGEPPRVRVFQELLEGEHLELVDASAWWTVGLQDMRRWGPHWSNDQYRVCGTQKGEFVELRLHVPETGRYRLGVCLTRSWDFGLVEVALDGRKIGGDPFDGLHGPAGPVERVDYGTFELTEGPHRLRFTAVDKNPKSAGYSMGIDYVQLIPARRSP